MLIIKAFVNENQIDEIYVQNTENLGFGLYEYTIRLPEGDWPKIKHNRQDGWRVLANKVLRVLEEEGIEDE